MTSPDPRILCINPGSTSTKVAAYAGQTELFSEDISHAKAELASPEGVQGQLALPRSLKNPVRSAGSRPWLLWRS